MMSKRTTQPLRRQRGAALFVSLILLLVLTLIGVTAAQMQTLEERMALNDDNHQLALQSGEAVLRDSEDQFRNHDYDSYAWDGTNGAYTIWDEAAAGSSVADSSPSSFRSSTINYAGPSLTGVPVGTPYVLIEKLPYVSSPLGGMPGSGYLGQLTTVRTTTLANGADSTSTVVVQSVAYTPP